jgi:hypothetical protein
MNFPLIFFLLGDLFWRGGVAAVGTQRGAESSELFVLNPLRFFSLLSTSPHCSPRKGCIQFHRIADSDFPSLLAAVHRTSIGENTCRYPPNSGPEGSSIPVLLHTFVSRLRAGFLC